MTEQYPRPIKYSLAKLEVDEAIAAFLPMLLKIDSICKDEIVELFGITPLELANIPFGNENYLNVEPITSQ